MHHSAKKFEGSNNGAKVYDVCYTVLDKYVARSRLISGGACISQNPPIHTCDGPMDMLLLDSVYRDMHEANTFTHTKILAVVDGDNYCLPHLDATVITIDPALEICDERVLLVEAMDKDLLPRYSAFDGGIIDNLPVYTFDRVDVDLGDNKFILSYNCECLGPYRTEEPTTFIVYMPAPTVLKGDEEIRSVAFGKDISENVEIVNFANSKLLGSGDTRSDKFLKITMKTEV